MIQLNLLPDIKIQFIKGQHIKRLVMLISAVAAAVGVTLVVVTFALASTQKAHLGNLDEDIKQLTEELENTPELSRILSVQNQLTSLPSLYDQRPAIDRLPTFIDQTTPQGVKITRFMINYAEGKIEVTGLATSLELVNSFADTIKYTTYSYTDENNETVTNQAYKDVVLLQFGRSDVEASYTLSYYFDPLIFDITKNVSLTVPNLQTTGAAPPNAVFVVPTQEEAEE